MYMIRLLSVASAYAVILLEIYSGVINGPTWWILPGGLFLSLLTALIMFGSDLAGGQGGGQRSLGANIFLWSGILIASFGMSWLSNHFGRVVVPDLLEQRVPGAPAGDFSSAPVTQTADTEAPPADKPEVAAVMEPAPDATPPTATLEFLNRVWRGPFVEGTPEGSMMVLLSNGLGISQSCLGDNEVFKWRQVEGERFAWTTDAGLESEFLIRAMGDTGIEVTTGLEDVPLASSYEEVRDIYRCPDPALESTP